jgi:hypothetical protein
MAPGSSSFSLTKEEFYQLTENRGEDQREWMNSPPFDGIDGILKKLRVSNVDHGLDGQNKIDLEERRSAFGKNQYSGTQRDRQVTVVRNGRSQQIPVVEIVVGDVCVLKIGKMLYTSNNSTSGNS